MTLAEAGIKLYGGVLGDADEAAQALAEGRLEYDPDVKCDYHVHEEGHECGHGDHGWTPEGVKAHQARRGTEMFPITIAEHLEILKNAGFTTVDILWVSYMQAGFWAVK